MDEKLKHGILGMQRCLTLYIAVISLIARVSLGADVPAMLTIDDIESFGAITPADEDQIKSLIELQAELTEIYSKIWLKNNKYLAIKLPQDIALARPVINAKALQELHSVLMLIDVLQDISVDLWQCDEHKAFLKIIDDNDLWSKNLFFSCVELSCHQTACENYYDSYRLSPLYQSYLKCNEECSVDNNPPKEAIRRLLNSLSNGLICDPACASYVSGYLSKVCQQYVDTKYVVRHNARITMPSWAGGYTHWRLGHFNKTLDPLKDQGSIDIHNSDIFAEDFDKKDIDFLLLKKMIDVALAKNYRVQAYWRKPGWLSFKTVRASH